MQRFEISGEYVFERCGIIERGRLVASIGWMGQVAFIGKWQCPKVPDKKQTQSSKHSSNLYIVATWGANTIIARSHSLMDGAAMDFSLFLGKDLKGSLTGLHNSDLRPFGPLVIIRHNLQFAKSIR